MSIERAAIVHTSAHGAPAVATPAITTVSAEEKALVAGTPQPTALPYTLRFMRWQCGHHMQRPADIPVASQAQALLILQAIGAATMQPGSAQAVLFDQTRGTPGYTTDDYASFVYGGAGTSDGPNNWPHRPVVLHGRAETLARIRAPALEVALEMSFYADLTAWDGTTQVHPNAVITTTLSREEIEQLAAPCDLPFDERVPLFDLPPVLHDAEQLLDELRREQDGINAYEADLEADRLAAP